MLPGLLEQGDHLLTLHAGETLLKLLDRITRFQMIEQALRRHACSRKHRFTAEHLGIVCDHAAHVETIGSKRAEYEQREFWFSSFIIESPAAASHPLRLTSAFFLLTFIGAA